MPNHERVAYSVSIKSKQSGPTQSQNPNDVMKNEAAHHASPKTIA